MSKTKSSFNPKTADPIASHILRCPWGFICLFLLVQLVIFSQAAIAFSEGKPPKDLEEAKKWFQKGFEAYGFLETQFQMDEERTTFTCKDKDNQAYDLNFATVISIALTHEKSGVWRVTFLNYTDNESHSYQDIKRDRAEQFEQALRFLVHQAIQNVGAAMTAKFDKFQPQAETWRKSAVKPKMPDVAYEHKVLAENAYKDKDLVKALIEYDAALNSFPTWPEGQFNLALIAGEMKRYRSAVLHMEEYLALVPDAPDAQAARDKIIIWKDHTTYR
jgi:tetratricopeptide (TPR) repeat protein